MPCNRTPNRCAPAILLPLLLLCSLCACATPADTTKSPAAWPHNDRFPTAAVAADHPLASRAGAEMLEMGGNAVDAAVAASFTLSVVRPYSCGIGGGGFMVISLPDHPERGPVLTALNYRETAPAAVGPDFYQNADDPRASTVGATAAGVPGTVRGLLYALDRYGTLDRNTVLQPAIRAAEHGFKIDDHFAGSVASAARNLERIPDSRTRFPYSWKILDNYLPLEPGDTATNPDHARALRLIADRADNPFYEGPIADAIVSASQRDSGVITREDLRNYRVSETEPLVFTAAGRTFITMPPPSSGGIAMAQTLAILDRAGFLAGAVTQWNDDAIHTVTEAFKHAFADRAEWLGDPAFVDVPIDRLLDDDYLDGRAALFDPDRTLDPMRYGTRPENADPVSPPPDRPGTSHLSVADGRGGAVACTETINTTFGSLLAVEPFGFFLNNEMDDFLTRRGRPNVYGLRQSERNLPEPGKRPLSSMSPTIVLDADGNVEAVVGASGGPRIISGSTIVLLNALVLGKDAGDAVASPRFHHQWAPDRIDFEPDWTAATDWRQLRASLQRRGHTVRPAGAGSVVQLIIREGDHWHAASDPRKGGAPAGH